MYKCSIATHGGLVQPAVRVEVGVVMIAEPEAHLASCKRVADYEMRTGGGELQTGAGEPALYMPCMARNT